MSGYVEYGTTLTIGSRVGCSVRRELSLLFVLSAFVPG